MPHEPSPGTGTLSNYATTIGHGSVSAGAPATGTTITATSLPLSGAGVKYAFGFPGTTSGAPATPAGATGTYDPVAKTGAINFAGSLVFTAHDGTFFSVVNPRLQFDAPQSIRLIANGQVAAGTVGSSDPPANYGTAATRQTVFALNGAAATTTENPDGSYTISSLAPSGTPQAAPVGYLSTSGPFDGIRPWFTIDRAEPAVLGDVRAQERSEPSPSRSPVGSDQSLTVNGSVCDALSLTLNATSTSLGSFVPGVAANYDASVHRHGDLDRPVGARRQGLGRQPGLPAQRQHAAGLGAEGLRHQQLVAGLLVLVAQRRLAAAAGLRVEHRRHAADRRSAPVDRRWGCADRRAPTASR